MMALSIKDMNVENEIANTKIVFKKKQEKTDLELIKEWIEEFKKSKTGFANLVWMILCVIFYRSSEFCYEISYFYFIPFVTFMIATMFGRDQNMPINLKLADEIFVGN